MPRDAENYKEKRRIFCVITQGHEGGAQRFVSQLAHNLDGEKFLLHIVWSASSGTGLAHALPAGVAHTTLNHLRRAVSPWHDFQAIYELRRHMREFRPDVVLCVSSKAGFIGSRAAHGLRSEFPNMKVIYRIGGWTFNDPWPAWKKKLYIWLERLSASWKDIIVLNNSHDFQQARELGIRPRHELLKIYNGLDAYLPFLERETARAFLDHRIPESYQRNPSPWLVGTVANLYETKGVETLIDAATRTEATVRFVVIGDGPLQRTLEQSIIRAGLSHRFFLLGRIKDAWKYLPGLDAFVLPSLKEGFSWALLEAMAAKIPIVATRVGAAPEMIEHGTSGLLCEPGDAEGLARSIMQLLKDSELRQSMTIDAHQRVLNTFTLREMMSQYEKLLS
jgi:glycosyltransferase involved in cell wall biosynthesis